MADYDEARLVSDQRGWPRPTKQSYGMRHRIVEADQAARRDDRLFEVHPEVSFRELAGVPLASKRSHTGMTQRLAVLAGAGIELTGEITDDLLDAAAAAWSADRYACGEALRFPAAPATRLGAIWR